MLRPMMLSLDPPKGGPCPDNPRTGNALMTLRRVVDRLGVVPDRDKHAGRAAENGEASWTIEPAMHTLDVEPHEFDALLRSSLCCHEGSKPVTLIDFNGPTLVDVLDWNQTRSKGREVWRAVQVWITEKVVVEVLSMKIGNVEREVTLRIRGEGSYTA
jgi:hypothetical protein